MRTYRGSHRDLARETAARAVVLGTFDGVHRGHQAIMAEAIAIARARSLAGVTAVTFGRHPRVLLAPDRSPRILTSPREKERLLWATDIEQLVVLEFDDELASMEYDQFVREVLLGKLHMSHFVLGHDVHFGHDRGGNYQTVAELAEREGFTLSQVASVRADGEPISSTRVRDAIAGGKMEQAGAWMGHPYAIAGVVEVGRGAGRTLGFPTANVGRDDAGKLLPPKGVYAGWAQPPETGIWHAAVINIGIAPTVTDGSELRIEAHILDYEGDLYGQTLFLGLVSRLRDEVKFDGPGNLVAQIERDILSARDGLDSVPAWGHPSRLNGPPDAG